nr:hypothetical protein Itr_chr04CG16050 [Ipomoea trifida]
MALGGGGSGRGVHSSNFRRRRQETKANENRRRPSLFSDGAGRVTTRRSSPFVGERLPQPRRLAEQVGTATSASSSSFPVSPVA